MKNKGITLIALVITIIVLLILAGVSISMLSGDNGLLKKAGQAKDDSVVGEEKEQVELAYISAAVKKLGNDVTYSDLQDELDISVGANKVKVTQNANNTLNVLFKDTEHNYNVNDGNVTKIENGGGNQSDDYDKIYAYLYNKTQDDFSEWDDSLGKTIYKDSTTVGIIGSDITELGGKPNSTDTGAYIYIQYNSNIYVYDYDWNTEKVIAVAEMNIDENTFGEQGIGERKILVTPSTPDNLIHCYYRVGRGQDHDDNEIIGYCANDVDGNTRYYDYTGALIQGWLWLDIYALAD